MSAWVQGGGSLDVDVVYSPMPLYLVKGINLDYLTTSLMVQTESFNRLVMG